MAVYTLFCHTCDTATRKVAKKPPELQCSVCGETLKFSPGETTFQVKEIIDNGAMPRRVEVLKDINKLMKERSKNDSTKVK